MMSPENLQIVLWILGGVCTILGWFGRQLWNAVQDLKSEVGSMRLLIGSEYIRYDRLQDALKPLMESLQEIKVTLSGKADK